MTVCKSLVKREPWDLVCADCLSSQCPSSHISPSFQSHIWIHTPYSPPFSPSHAHWVLQGLTQMIHQLTTPTPSLYSCFCVHTTCAHTMLYIYPVQRHIVVYILVLNTHTHTHSAVNSLAVSQKRVCLNKCMHAHTHIKSCKCNVLYIESFTQSCVFKTLSVATTTKPHINAHITHTPSLNLPI